MGPSLRTFFPSPPNVYPQAIQTSRESSTSSQSNQRETRPQATLLSLTRILSTAGGPHPYRNLFKWSPLRPARPKMGARRRYCRYLTGHPPTNIPFPNEEPEEKNADKPHVPRPAPTPGELRPLAKCSIPAIEQLRDVVVHPLDACHRSHSFLALAPPDLEHDNRMAVRVMKRDGTVLAHSIGLWPGMPEKWDASDSMMVDPQSGRLVAVTKTSIMVFDL